MSVHYAGYPDTIPDDDSTWDWSRVTCTVCLAARDRSGVAWRTPPIETTIEEIMTAKDYRIIAGSVKAALGAASTSERPGVLRVAANLARDLKTTNPRFDEERFLAGCGVPDNQ